MAKSHADAFLQAILHDPDDDTPRLIFADWLEERGDPANTARAEFIRIQCALADGELTPQQRAEWDNRQQVLLEQYGEEWARPVRRLARRWHFHRGFIDAVSMWDDSFVARANRLFRFTPIQHLHLRPHRRPADVYNRLRISIPELADNKYLHRLRSLDLRENLLRSEDVRALVVSQHLTNLTSLNLSHNRFGNSGLRALADAPLLRGLTHLDLRHNDFGAAGMRVLIEVLENLAHSPEELRLRVLDLRDNPISDAGRRAVADSSVLRGRVRL